MNLANGDGRESGPDAHPDNFDQQLATPIEHIIITPDLRDAYLSHQTHQRKGTLS